MSDPTFSHLSFCELGFYNEIPRRFWIKEENHSLSVQKNILTNEFEVIKKYDREIPKIVFFKDMKGILKSINQEEELNIFNLFPKILRGGNLQEFMKNCLSVVYKTKDLWEAISKAEEIRAIYYKNEGQKSKYKRCLHHEPALAPLCLLK